MAVRYGTKQRLHLAITFLHQRQTPTPHNPKIFRESRTSSQRRGVSSIQNPVTPTAMLIQSAIPSRRKKSLIKHLANPLNYHPSSPNPPKSSEIEYSDKVPFPPHSTLPRPLPYHPLSTPRQTPSPRSARRARININDIRQIQHRAVPRRKTDDTPCTTPARENAARSAPQRSRGAEGGDGGRAETPS